MDSADHPTAYYNHESGYNDDFDPQAFRDVRAVRGNSVAEPSNPTGFSHITYRPAAAVNPYGSSTMNANNTLQVPDACYDYDSGPGMSGEDLTQYLDSLPTFELTPSDGACDMPCEPAGHDGALEITFASQFDHVSKPLDAEKSKEVKRDREAIANTLHGKVLELISRMEYLEGTIDSLGGYYEPWDTRPDVSSIEEAFEQLKEEKPKKHRSKSTLRSRR
uniref:Uncharacterized protein n=1 Tax=Kwoniella bestiolae CBS 10118 TaxID=1296100 RepID=A0A1B9GGS0_9TREE|nr:hypothetical protein I302_01670 [Kwoniella bestiolae CBS 10118]OCF30151.1 hypothetical protein I302_01670 [Kwoniella bestiolae CBS 10118]